MKVITHVVVVGLVAAGGAGLMQAAARAQNAAPQPSVTFAKDVAPILYNSCVSCHRAGEVAPMSLVSYEEARPWAKSIKAKVVSREMPPWFAEPGHAAIRDDRSLSQAQVDVIAAWADSGAPRGNDADMPKMPTFAGNEWHYGKPDAILEMPIDFALPAEGELDIQRFYVKVPFTEDKFVQKMEVLPGNRAVAHHMSMWVTDLPDDVKVIDGRAVDAAGKMLPPEKVVKLGEGSFETEGSSKIVCYVPGRGWEELPDGVAKRIPAGSHIEFNMHYQVSGKPETDRTRLAFWFSKGPVKHEMLQRGVGETYVIEGKEITDKKIPNIPPYAENWQLVGMMPVREDMTLYGMSPHMHLRGKSMRYDVVYPDGRLETVLDVKRYDFNWQLYYELAKPLKIPAGSKLVNTAVFDNSLSNPYNPAPEKEVYWSEQSWDEMYSPQIRMSFDNQSPTDATFRVQQEQKQR